MRKTIRVMLLAFVIMISVMSCNNEELFIEPIVEEVVDDEIDDNQEDKAEEVEVEVDSSLPCDFKLNNAEPNSTIVINCILDLGGSTVSLPEGVTFLYEGGDIINGTLNLSDNTIISGELLNATLVLGGSAPQLKDSAFNFYPQRWGIVEGKVTDEVALKNKNILNDVIALSIKVGVSIFEIDKMDAFFYVASDSNKHEIEDAIHIPSNFHLKMGDDCNLRTQPNHFVRSAIILSKSTDNVTVSGGKLWGDRYTHDYKTISGAHDWGHLIMFRGVHNGIVDGVEMHEGVGDGFQVGGVGHRLDDGNIKSEGRESINIIVKNCLMDDNRRNNISIVDGTDIYIEYNTIRNAGSGDDALGVSSNGTSPRCGVDIEAHKRNAPDNNSVYDWERTENVHIRNNIFEDNYAVDVALYNGENTYVYENVFKSRRGVSAAYSYNNKIYDNRFERPIGLQDGSVAINLSPRYWANGNHRITDFEIYNNTIIGHKTGIIAGGQGHKFENNTVTDCRSSFTLVNSEGLIFNNNTISSSNELSGGFSTYTSEATIKNCLIKNGKIRVGNRSLSFQYKNNVEPGNITIDNMDLGTIVYLKSAQNVTIKNSSFNDIAIEDCNPILINNN